MGEHIPDAVGALAECRRVLRLLSLTGGPISWPFLMEAVTEFERVFSSDGIPDDVDKCPDDPEDFDDFEDEDGCPDPDNDRDGILDKDDKCPNEPETKNGFEDEDGCPDDDNDKDGIPDKKDKCPNKQETINGYKDDDGCPDEVKDTDQDGIPNGEALLSGLDVGTNQAENELTWGYRYRFFEAASLVSESPWSPIKFAEAVENGSPDSELGIGTEGHALGRVVTASRLDQAVQISMVSQTPFAILPMPKRGGS